VSDCYSTTNINITNGLIYTVGGFVGDFEGADLYNCYSTGTITASGSIDWPGIGGFISYLWNENEMVHKCYYSGNIIFNGYTTDTYYGIGGFVSTIDTSTIENCYSEGNINITLSGNGYDIGGFCNTSYGVGCTINNCYSDMDIDITTGVNTITNVGGFHSFIDSDDMVLTNCFSAGNITITGNGVNVGGFIGYRDASCLIVTNCAWYNAITTNAIGYDEDTAAAITTLAEISYGTDETDNTKFYNVILKSPGHVVYDQGNADAWDFSTPIWYEWSDRYPLFIPEPIIAGKPIIFHSRLDGKPVIFHSRPNGKPVVFHSV
jgi:hypothetical protein